MMSEDCIFCKIVSGEIPANKLYEDDEVIAFLDMHPQKSISKDPGMLATQTRDCSAKW